MHHIRPNYDMMYSFTFNHKHEIYFDLDETKAFDEWIVKIGDGNIGDPNDGEAKIEFSEDVVVRSIGDHIHSIVSIIYLSFENHLDDQSYFQDKAILVPTNEEFDATNDYILGLMKDEGKTYEFKFFT
uniref:ATP-dependent DNA helicase n=1 Tax=Lactuca sativa TaxID=4236 RepID=A0A9R1UIP8_LACSA|nr:hypothetical protein LSAT_V11C900492010 [Lactuca sativa]